MINSSYRFQPTLSRCLPLECYLEPSLRAVSQNFRTVRYSFVTNKRRRRNSAVCYDTIVVYNTDPWASLRPRIIVYNFWQYWLFLFDTFDVAIGKEGDIHQAKPRSRYKCTHLLRHLLVIVKLSDITRRAIFCLKNWHERTYEDHTESYLILVYYNHKNNI